MFYSKWLSYSMLKWRLGLSLFSVCNAHTCMHECSVSRSHLTLCDSMDCTLPDFCFPGKNTWVVCHFLHQGVFLIKGLNPCPLHWRWIVYHWATREVPYPHCMCMLHILFCAKIKLSSSYAMKKWTNSHHLAYFSFLVPTATPCWRRQWHPTPVLLPGKSHGRRSLVGCSPFGIENFRKLINN